VQTFTNIYTLQATLNDWRSEGKTIAFVPTMGGLHDGHLSLVELAKQKADKVVVSVFVNPTQFGKGEDFDKYPNTFEQDKSLLVQHQADGLFTPDTEQIYPTGFDSDIEVGEIANILCGVSRPGHFQGVVQVVKRLFDIVKPNVAVFGQKDYQQLLIIQKMAMQFSPNVEIVPHPTLREGDGLAMSTRNKYLSADDRKTAPNLYKSLLQIKQGFLKNQSVDTLKKQAKEMLKQEFKLDYIEVLDANTLKQITDNTSKIAILCAVFIGSTRLIDNIIFNKG